MRVLVVGPGTALNTALACHVLRTLRTSPVQWHVITSYQSSVDLYQACPGVTNVTAFKDLKDDETPPDQGLVMEVLATSFFEKTWVKQRLKDGHDVLVVATSPVTLVDKSVLDTFDCVYISKTLAADKQSQYYTLFADTAKQSFTDFKKTVKGLATNQYARIQMEHGRPSKFEVESYPALWDQVGPASAASVAPVAPAVAVTGTVAPTTPVAVRHVERPSQAEPVSNTGRVEVWLCLTVAAGVARDDVVTNLKAMLSKDLLASMMHQVLYTTSEDSRRVDVYVQVFEIRQDLFVSLAFNILQALRGVSLITQGALVVL